MANGFSQYPNGVDGDNNLLNLKDRSTTFLVSDISDSATSFTVVSAVNFPTGVQIVTIDSERILCSGRSGNTFTVETRGFSDSTAAAHLANTKVSGNWTAHHHNNIADAIIATQTELEATKAAGAIKARNINTTAPLQGGGDLTEDRTLSIDPATTSDPGSMSASDKTKLDGIANNANNYVHPNHSGDVVSTGDGATLIQDGVVTDAKLSTGINANKIGDGSISNTEYQYLNGVTSAIQTQLNARQPLDSDLTAIAALAPPNDDILQRKAGVWQNRTPVQFKVDLALVKGDVGLGNVDNTSDLDKPISNSTQTALDTKVDENSPITGATKTKVTYDAKGLVTAGADATTADINDSTNRRYVTDADLIDIGNLSGVNTGDQDLSGLQPLDSDLTTIAGLTPSNDDILQRKAGAWTNRTLSQVKTDLALNNVDNTSDVNKPVSTAQQTAIDAKVADAINDGTTTVAPSQNAVFDALTGKQNTLGFTPENAANKGAAGGYAPLNGSGTIDSAYLPASVDEILEYNDLASFPGTGVTDKIYLALDTNLAYRWSGSVYVEISPSIALGETSSTAYRGDRGKAAYDHSLVASGNPHNVNKADVGLGNVINIDTTNTVNISDSSNKRFVTDSQRTVIQNTSGVNTGDQDLSGLQPIDSDLTAIAGLSPSNDDILQRKAGAWINRTPAQLKTDLSLTKSDVGLGSVVNSDTTTTANITDSSNKRFVTDSEKTVIGNTSGTNSGDNATNSQYSGLAASKQDTLVSGSNLKTINGETLLGSGNITITGGGGVSPTGNLDAIAKVNVRRNGIQIGARRGINFIPGLNVTISATDDSVNEEVDITINSTGGGSASGGGTDFEVDKVLVYTGEQLTSISSELGTQTLIYTDGKLTSIVGTGAYKSKTFNYTGDQLTSIDVTS